MREEYILKMIVIGSASVGKSSLVHHYVHGSFSNSLMQTTGVEYSSKSLLFQSHTLKLQIWDTAGQERFKSITKTYYRGAKGALIVFDLTSKASFLQCREWLSLLDEVCGQAIGCVLIGNKKDLEEQREVSFSEVSQFAEAHQLEYMETSCVTGEGVRRGFDQMVEVVFAKMEAGQILKEDIIRKRPALDDIMNRSIEEVDVGKKGGCRC